MLLTRLSVEIYALAEYNKNRRVEFDKQAVKVAVATANANVVPRQQRYRLLGT
jgi:hypothetical protein